MIAYLDDICCFGNNFEKALARLEEIFIRLDEAGLKFKTNKCTLLGDTNFPITRKVKDLRAFEGLTNCNGNYIKKFAKIASPLTDLTRTTNKFHWDQSQDNAFNTLKNAIITTSVLTHFEDEYPVFITTDASLKWIPSIIHLTCIFAGNVDKMTYSSSIPGLSWSSNIVGWNLQGSTGNFFIG
ncbi:hypothetical protein QTP88_023660 [Uroleucon formosanum]